MHDALIVGGGFFGIYLAVYLERKGIRPVIIEREEELMTRASYNNQARVHNGCHYPRSMITAIRSRVNFPRFIREFPECIVGDFEKYYAVSRVFSKVSADQYERFMARAGISWEPAPKHVLKLFDRHMIERVWKVKEVVFDARILKNTLQKKLTDTGIPVYTGMEAVSISQGVKSLKLNCLSKQGAVELEACRIFNCTYSGINILRTGSGLAPIPLKHEATELALVEPPSELKNIAVTVMCGPFFSMLPFPSREQWTLSHVRLTPHFHWTEGSSHPYADPYQLLARNSGFSNAGLMIRDSARYLPLMNKCRHLGSLWEIKTTLPQSEIDDSRPIMIHRDSKFPGFYSILGGKIDNVYDLENDLDEILANPV